MDFNATERRALRTAALLIAAGSLVRVLASPSPADVGWAPADSGHVHLSELREDVRTAVERAAEAARPLSSGERVDPNSASETQLQRLPGIGPATAAAIVRHRIAHGGFRSAGDLEAVPGIGPTRSARLAPYLSFGAAPVAASGRALRPVEVNRAQVEELQQITGIGPALASRIIEVRRRLGRFERAEDLLLVPGIGPGILAKIRDQVRFD